MKSAPPSDLVARQRGGRSRFHPKHGMLLHTAHQIEPIELALSAAAVEVDPLARPKVTAGCELCRRPLYRSACLGPVEDAGAEETTPVLCKLANQPCAECRRCE